MQQRPIGHNTPINTPAADMITQSRNVIRIIGAVALASV